MSGSRASGLGSEAVCGTAGFATEAAGENSTSLTRAEGEEISSKLPRLTLASALSAPWGAFTVRVDLRHGPSISALEIREGGHPSRHL